MSSTKTNSNLYPPNRYNPNTKNVKPQTSPKTPVTHGRMYHRIAAGYQIWKIVSDLWIIFFIREHIRTIRNFLVTSATDVMCLWRLHEKSKLLEFSVKGLWILSVINMLSVKLPLHPYSFCTCPWLISTN